MIARLIIHSNGTAAGSHPGRRTLPGFFWKLLQDAKLKLLPGVCTKLLPGVCLGLCMLFAGGVFSDLSDCPVLMNCYAQEIRYEELRTLLEAGNPDLKYMSYYTSLENVQKQLEVLRQETRDLVARGKLTEDEALSQEYQSNAENMNRTIKRLDKQLEKLTGPTAQIESTLDMLTMSAQSSMISYLQAENQAEVKELQAAAAEESYQNTATRIAAGAATDKDLTSAHARMLSTQADALSARQSADNARRTLLDMLGLQDDGSVTFAEPAVPEGSVIDALNYDADLEAAVNNDSRVKSIRHGRASSSAEIALKAASEEEAVGNAKRDFIEAHTLLLSRRQEYESALAAKEAAEHAWAGAQRKKSAGMLTRADELEAEASYRTAMGAYRSAAMNYVSAYSNYCWIVKGRM